MSDLEIKVFGYCMYNKAKRSISSKMRGSRVTNNDRREIRRLSREGGAPDATEAYKKRKIRFNIQLHFPKSNLRNLQSLSYDIRECR